MTQLQSTPAPASDPGAEGAVPHATSNAEEQHGHVHGPQCNHNHTRHHPITPFTYAQPKPGRNDPCLCGSGKKSKKCCG